MRLGAINVILPEIPRFYTALAEWLACMLFILEMKRRISGVRLAVVSVCVLTVQSLFMIATESLKGIGWCVCMAIAVGMMYLFICGSCNVNKRDAGYCCIRAFIMAEFMASLEWEMECFFYYDMNWKYPLVGIVWISVIYSTVFLICYLIDINIQEKREEIGIETKELVTYIIIGFSVFLASNLGYTPFNTPFTATFYPEIFNVRTIVDLGGIAILYACHIQRNNLKKQYELENIQNILHNQYTQYQQSQEAIDIINYKYHDLRHYILALKAEGNDEKRENYLERMEEELKNYGVQCRTGNKVLDTVLTSKNLYCMKRHIIMTCVVNGSLFDFMDTMDICSIFGNALDNAIECEETIEEKKRMIHVTAVLQKNFLLICFENYYEEKLEFSDDIPVTTKRNKQFHGFGLKSLRYTVRKYGGEINISTEDSWFTLKILIPYP